MGTETDVLREMEKIANVEALLVYGEYDIVLRVESNSMKELKQIVSWKIRKVNNVTATQTMVTV